MKHGLDLSFSAPDVTSEWCVRQIARGFEVLVVDLWTGNQMIPHAERALRTWREAGGITAGYFVIHEYMGASVKNHYERARLAAGQEWEHFAFCSVDVEVRDAPLSIDGVRRAHELVIASGVRHAPVYTSWSAWTEIIGHWPYVGCPELPLWTAQYDGRDDLNNVILYGGWQSVAGKQYTNSTDLEGITVDYDVFADSLVGGDMDTEKLVKALNDVWEVREALRQAAVLFPDLEPKQQKLFDAIVAAKEATGLQ